MASKNQIEFLRKKNYIFLEELGQGGTGKTILIKDDIIDEIFVCKKYSPFYPEHKEIYFKYFIDEIKILHQLYHKNIVRIFNYYLYPEKTTGYILMEYIKGLNISEYTSENSDKLDNLFSQVIEGFCHLEETGILHRDIRPENILVTKDGTPKIIDFGFGKNATLQNNDKSVSLNWRYSSPDEFSNNKYDRKSEIYFIGKLFEEIILSLPNTEFKHLTTIKQMTCQYEQRIESFFDVYREIINQSKLEYEFTSWDKDVYRNFANNLVNIIVRIPRKSKYLRDTDLILKSLEELYKNSILEEEVQNNNKLISIFIDGEYTYYTKKPFKTSSLKSMIKLLKSSSDDRRKIIIYNLWERLDKIERSDKVLEDDLPF